MSKVNAVTGGDVVTPMACVVHNGAIVTNLGVE
jgi:hypothetical protein